MEDLKTSAHRKATLNAFLKYKSRKDHAYKARGAEINTILAKPEFQFSKKGSGKKRIDIGVFSPEKEPLLIAEAKLGSRPPSKIIADIDRVIKLLQMHKELAVDDNLYGAIFFYRMLRGGSDAGVRGRAKSLLARINSYLEAEKVKPGQEWIKSKANLLTRGSVAGAVQVYEESHEDGATEQVFARKGYAFAPGLVLLGRADDVETVMF
jgi:hypothetical protein